MKLQTCPEPSQYAALFTGEPITPDLEPLLDHLEECSTCANLVQSQASPDNLVALIRGSVQAEITLPPLMDQWLNRLKASPPPTLSFSDGQDTGLDASPVSPGALSFLSPAQAEGEIGRLGGYRILCLLGQGGMGLVFKAEDPQLHRLVCLKVMHPHLARKDQHRQRFLREARAAVALKHDHVVTIHQVGEDNGTPFLAMELLEGESLDHRLQPEKILPLPEILHIGREIAEALKAAHDRNLIHRDIKPANIWLETRGQKAGGRGQETVGRKQEAEGGRAGEKSQETATPAPCPLTTAS